MRRFAILSLSVILLFHLICFLSPSTGSLFAYVPDDLGFIFTGKSGDSGTGYFSSSRAGTTIKGAFSPPGGAVNDFAGIIPALYRDSMERLSSEVLSKTGAAIIVATVPSTEGQDPDKYANHLFNAWGIGKKGEDRGVLLFLALKERRVRIVTGYGLEGLLPDDLVGSILDNHVLPDLRRGAYGPGFLKGMKALAGIIAKDAGVTLSME